MGQKQLGNPPKRKRASDAADDIKKPKLELDEDVADSVKEVSGSMEMSGLTDEMRENYSEILRHVLKFLDLKRLKTIRLVCKSWNTEICRSLRRRSYAPLLENQFKIFKNLQSQGQELSLPSPFKYLQIISKNFKEEHLTSVLNSQGSKIIKLAAVELGCYKDENPEAFHGILTSNGASLTHLRLDGINFRVKKHQVEKSYVGSPSSACSTPQSRTFVYYKNEVEYRREWMRSNSFQQKITPGDSEKPKKIELTELEYFAFSNFGMNEDCVEDEENSVMDNIHFLAHIINSAARLREMHISRIDADILDQIFSISKLSKIISFHAENISDDHLQLLSSLHLPNLEYLTLRQDEKFFGNLDALNRSTVVDNELLSVIGNFSSSLIKLDLTWNWSSFDFESVCCPKLKVLSLKSARCPLDNLECFTADLFPELEEVNIDRYYPYRCSEFVEDHHDGVKKISVDVSSRGPDHLQHLMSSLQQKFPCAISFEVRLGSDAHCVAKTIECLGEYFPQLQSLSLDSQKVLDNSPACLGITEDMLTEARKEERASQQEDVFRGISILKFKSLSKLSFGSSIQLTSEMIQFGIAQIKSLKKLEIFWPEDSVTPEIMVQSLQDLSDITINNCCAPRNTKILENIFLKHDCFKCGCKNQRDFSAQFEAL